MQIFTIMKVKLSDLLLGLNSNDPETVGIIIDLYESANYSTLSISLLLHFSGDGFAFHNGLIKSCQSEKNNCLIWLWIDLLIIYFGKLSSLQVAKKWLRLEAVNYRQTLVACEESGRGQLPVHVILVQFEWRFCHLYEFIFFFLIKGTWLLCHNNENFTFLDDCSLESELCFFESRK